MRKYRKHRRYTYRGHRGNHKKRNFAIVVITIVILGIAYLFGGFSFVGLKAPNIFPARLGWDMAMSFSWIVIVLFVAGVVAAYQIFIGRMIRF